MLDNKRLEEPVEAQKLDSATLDKLIDGMDRSEEFTADMREYFADMLTHANIKIGQIPHIGGYLFLRADSVRNVKGFDPELDSLEDYLKDGPEDEASKDGEVAPGDGSGDITYMITMALVDHYLESAGLSPEEIEECTSAMRKAMAVVGK
jgi:hypothetical protein